MAKHRKPKSKTQDTTSEPGLLDLSEDEQWRIVNQTGILKKLSSSEREQRTEDEERVDFGDEVFNATLFIIPMSFLLLLMEMCYGRKPTYMELADRMVPGVPILSVFIFYTTRYKRYRTMQFLLFVLSVVVGPRLVYLINRASWRVVMKQCPPLATLWVYAVLQLDLGPATLNMIIVGSWMWYKEMKIFL
ncbi:uncharacterized protein FIBRA_07878 [Fibroporia radiculosa]|uniref:DUF7719 domain-containing protein n=1 Tax=Fibroporia radiculosa TaxID=599839 RepID=J4GFT1_9APHY|nr:uncharacterized protein FIBRA_07878 [Fibroporia radiculosa]CCM05648.1 predicted protein [Fibroporia radiculosa]